MEEESSSHLKRRRRSDGERNRSRLIAAAKLAFAERGGAASLEGIAPHHPGHRIPECALAAHAEFLATGNAKHFRQDSTSWPTTPSGKTAREDHRAAHGTLGGLAGIADIDPRSLARGQQRSGYGFRVFAPLTIRCRGTETPLMENQGVTCLRASGTCSENSGYCPKYHAPSRAIFMRRGWAKAHDMTTFSRM